MYPRHSNSTISLVNETPAAENVPLRKSPVYVSPRLGLYYQPERWAKRRVMPEPRFITVTPATDILMPKGAYYRPGEWPGYIKPVKKPVTGKIFPPGRGIYYQPAEWQEYVKQKSVRQPAVCLYDVEKLMQQPLQVVRPPKLKRPMAVTVPA